ncbi:uncharacterized protein PG986_014809 [Apiospora aurea]|uniref:Uncharacterized protein n=1 Tax=Apiospora aurea TaxID=335848 RepID=A0ABR1PU13_9PEZI
MVIDAEPDFTAHVPWSPCTESSRGPAIQHTPLGGYAGSKLLTASGHIFQSPLRACAARLHQHKHRTSAPSAPPAPPAPPAAHLLRQKLHLLHPTAPASHIFSVDNVDLMSTSLVVPFAGAASLQYWVT